VTRTFVDSSVLLTAWRGREGSEQGLAVLEADDREFCTSQMVRLELLPKPGYFKNQLECAFYGLHFARVQAEEPLSQALGDEAMKLGGKFGVAAADALNLCAAIRLGAKEFITAEKPGKPMFRVPAIQVLSIHSSRDFPGKTR
jgi:predicted nucleic acid-binding protein